jgi:serine/threonine protein kinase
MWSLGITIIVLMTGKPPYPTGYQTLLYQKRSAIVLGIFAHYYYYDQFSISISQ